MLSPRPSRQSGEDNLHPLNPVVANLKLLSIKAENYHWNVTGANFGSLHKLFEDIDTVADEWSDIVAERLRGLQHPVKSTAGYYHEVRWFSEGVHSYDSSEMLSDMVETLETITSHVTRLFDTEDDVTSNILQELVAAIDKLAYFVRSSR